MHLYYVNKLAQLNGDHEVHREGCLHPAAPFNQMALGYHANCWTAVALAKGFYPRANGCYYCSRICHTT